MTMLTDCPEPIRLSQLLDHEVAEKEADILRRHIDTCATCHTRFSRLARGRDLMQDELAQVAPQHSSAPLSSACFSPEQTAAYVHRLLPVVEHNAAEHHLRTCAACLSEVMEAFRVVRTLTSAERVSVPTILKTRVALQWRQAPPVTTSTAPALSRLVLQLAQKGLALVEQHLVAPLRDVQAVLAPMPAYRADEALPPLQLTLQGGQATIAITAVPEGTGLSLKMTIVGPDNAVLAGQRVFLRQGGSTVFSARTDRDGVIQIPHLEPDMYELSCTGIQTSFQLELRAPV